MNVSNFSKEELQVIEELLNSSNIINNIYNTLYELDITGQKDSTDYHKLIEMLQEAIKIEEEKYQNANLTIIEKINIIELLISSKNVLKKDNLSCIINRQYHDIVTRRVINILTNQILTSTNFTEMCIDIIPTEILELLNNFGITLNNNKAYKEITNYQIIETTISNDILSVFLVILNETLQSRKYTKYKNQLLKSIYVQSFINKDIEKQLINMKFNIPETIYIDSKFITDLLKADPTIYNMLTITLVEDELMDHILELLEVKDEDYQDENTEISSIIRQSYIRALLTFINDDRIYEINNEFHELIDHPLYLKVHPNDRISEEAIMKCFKNIKYDRTKKRTLSLKNEK